MILLRYGLCAVVSRRYKLVRAITKEKARPFAVSIAVVVGAAVGAFWIAMIRTPPSNFWNLGGKYHYMTWISFVTCPFIEIVEYRGNAVWVPILNSLVYGLSIYIIMSFAKRPVILVISILGAASGMFWMIVDDAGVNGVYWPSHFREWQKAITCPLNFLIGRSGFENGLLPFLNAFYWLFVYSLMRMIYRHFCKMFSSKNNSQPKSS
jgi:hypothetical protein